MVENVPRRDSPLLLRVLGVISCVLRVVSRRRWRDGRGQASKRVNDSDHHEFRVFSFDRLPTARLLNSLQRIYNVEKLIYH